MHVRDIDSMQSEPVKRGDPTRLNWVRRELDASLASARATLQTYRADRADATLIRACANDLHLIQGSLRMVELYGAAMVVEEMQRVADGLGEGKIAPREDVIDVLMRGLAQLPDYLDGLQRGQPDVPLPLLPLLNDLRAARGEKLLSESALFAPDLDLPLPPPAARALAVGDLHAEARRLRSFYQVALLNWIRDEATPTQLVRIGDVLERLYAACASNEARRLWWIASGVLDGVRAGAIAANPAVKLLFGKVDREIKRLVDEGDAGFASAAAARDLSRNLLYYLAHAEVASKRASDVRALYRLDALLPAAPRSADAAHSDTALLDRTAIAIGHDLARVRTALDEFPLDAGGASVAHETLVALGAQADALDRIADAVGVLGLGASRQALIAQRAVLADIAQERRPADAAALQAIAAALLQVQAELDDRADASVPDSSPTAAPADGDDLPVTDTDAVRALFGEAKANLEAAQQAVVAFVDAPWDFTRVEPVTHLLGAVSAVLERLGLATAKKYNNALVDFVERAVVQHRHVPNDDQLDAFADALASIEYYLDATRDGRSGRESILDITEASLLALNYWPASMHEERTAESAGVHEFSSDATNANAIEAAFAETAPGVPEFDEARIAGEFSAALPSAPSAFDPMLLEVLQSEAATHLDTIDDFVAQARASIAPPMASATLLRALHTLGGAVGVAELGQIGDVLRSLEDYAARLLAWNQSVDAEGIDALAQASTQIRNAIAALNQRSVPGPDFSLLTRRIGELRDALPEVEFLQSLLASAQDEASKSVFADRQSQDIASLATDSDSATAPLQTATPEDANADLEKAEVEATESAQANNPRQEFNAEPTSEFSTSAAALSEAAPSEPKVDGAESSEPVPAHDTPPATIEIPTGDDAPAALHADGELIGTFVLEAHEILDRTDAALTVLREAPQDRESIGALQRALHTLKGSARMSGIDAVGDLSHAMESVLDAIGESPPDSYRHALEVLQSSFDELHRLVRQVAQGHTASVPSERIRELDALAATLREAPPVAQNGAPAAPTEAAPFAQTDAPAPDASAAPEVRYEVLDSLFESAPAPAQTPQEFDHQVAASSSAFPQQTSPSPIPSPIETATPPAAADPIRVRADLLDDLVNHAGEVSIYRSRLQQQVADFRFNVVEFDATVTRLREQLRRLDIETETQILSRHQRLGETVAAGFDPLELDRYSLLQQLSRSLSESVSDLGAIQTAFDDLTRQSEALLLQQSRVSADLQDGLLRTRMQPFESLLPALRRTLRHSADELGKRAQLKVSGEQGELDRNLLERMKAPFEHLVRNALVHGIETPDERIAANKPVDGTVAITIVREANEVLIRIDDDGRGLDREAIRRRAVERGLLRADADIGDADLYAGILGSGFSTAANVTRLAGRGIGLDVVDNEIKQLGGSLAIDSTPGHGASFTLRLPFTLAIAQAIIVRLDDAAYAIPVTAVQGVVRITRDDLERRLASPEPTFAYRDDTYPIHELSSLLGQRPSHPVDDVHAPLLIVRSGDQRAAIHVDTVLGSREVVVKSAGPQLASVPGIFGATIMGDGAVVLILDLGPLLRRAAAKRAQDAMNGIVAAIALPVTGASPARPLIMVVDDSITMRKAATRVLERNGMEAVAASDGIDAIDKLHDRIPDLVVLDIEMPRMDGYEFAAYLRNDPRTRDIPVIMVTSRSGAKHRQRALQLGVERYLGKPYQETELLRNIREALQRVHTGNDR